MTLLFSLLYFAAFAFLLYTRSLTLLTYFQQEEYDNKRFLPAVWDVRLFDVKASAAILVLFGLHLAGLTAPLVILLLALAFVGIALWERRYRYKKPLAKTERALRIQRLGFAVMCMAGLSILWHPLFAIAALQLAPLALMLANALLAPLQESVNEKYQTQAREKLARLDPVRIGITGSFGKTTVKHMFAEILEASDPVYYSPGSINTVLGHTRHIRQRLQFAHKYFVAEMGAYGIGSIKRLCDFIQPNYGIVTAVGDAHTERFGSIENIALAKSELVRETCGNGGTIVLNADVLQYKPFADLHAFFPDQILSVGFKGDDTQTPDVTVDAQEIEGGNWAITLTSKDIRVPNIQFELPLLGEHNVMNAALAVTMALVIDPQIAGQIPYFTKTVAQIPHRLQKTGAPGAALILDDAYNSNEIGFKSAVISLDRLAKERGGRRILVTPGIAELGLEHDNVHGRLGKLCAAHCDLIYAVNPARIHSFVSAASGGEAEIIEVPNFMAARQAIAAHLTPQDVVLYENDLPDLLEEKRLL